MPPHPGLPSLLSFISFMAQHSLLDPPKRTSGSCGITVGRSIPGSPQASPRWGNFKGAVKAVIVVEPSPLTLQVSTEQSRERVGTKKTELATSF